MMDIREKLIDCLMRSSGYEKNQKFEKFSEEMDYYRCEAGFTSIADDVVKSLPDILNGSEWIRLPCKVGDDVWIIYNNKVCLGYVRYFKMQDYLKEIKLLVGISNRDYYKSNCNYFVVDNLNKTWFLTREQAEARLKKLLEGKE